MQIAQQQKVWTVRFGGLVARYYTEYHARQMVDALRANGTAVCQCKDLCPVCSLTTSATEEARQ